MTEAGSWVLGDELHRKLIGSLIAGAERGWVVTLEEPTRTGDQNAAVHAALSDIAKQLNWKGLGKWSVLTWKRMTTYSFLREIGEAPAFLPALDGHGMDVIFEKTSKMSIKRMSAYLEWLYHFGAWNGVRFRGPPT